MSDTTDQFVITRFIDGSWSLEINYSDNFGEKEEYGHLSLMELLESLFGVVKNGKGIK